ncbi:MAG: hypothetical protein JNK87_30625 [Bryobacterales bacterium]|nr:hypothetical protein [Bryobacterales bacterium]
MKARGWAWLLVGAAAVWSCGFDASLRRYLQGSFWAPFPWLVTYAAPERAGPAAAGPGYAGMKDGVSSTPMDELRAAYRTVSDGGPAGEAYKPAQLEGAIERARARPPASLDEREEIDLIDAKIDMRGGENGVPELRLRAKSKLEAFLKTARTPAWRSEARGWLGHIYYQLGDQTSAGKIYLDELERVDSTLAREKLLLSLRQTYRADNVDKLLRNLEAYFDTPSHAAFAIKVVSSYPMAGSAQARIAKLLEQHRGLFATPEGAGMVAELGMMAALRSGDPRRAVTLGMQVPRSAPVRRKPEFLWLLGSAQFLTRDYAAAEAPLLALYRSPRSTSGQRDAAASALCGVYAKTGNYVEQIRMMLATRGMPEPHDLPLYWAYISFDLGLLLDIEAPVEALRVFLENYPRAAGAEAARYALAVRATRQGEFEEAAALFDSLQAKGRAARTRRLADLHRDGSAEGRYRLAEYLAANSTRLFFNDRLWHMMQRYAMVAGQDERLTLQERQRLMAAERELLDSQEEYWQAYQILEQVRATAEDPELRSKAARLAIRCLRRINSERFGREGEIASADIRLSGWLKAQRQ